MSDYHLQICHSRDRWIEGMTQPFPCDCGLLDLIHQETQKARNDELRLLDNGLFPPPYKRINFNKLKDYKIQRQAKITKGAEG